MYDSIANKLKAWSVEVLGINSNNTPIKAYKVIANGLSFIISSKITGKLKFTFFHLKKMRKRMALCRSWEKTSGKAAYKFSVLCN